MSQQPRQQVKRADRGLAGWAAASAAGLGWAGLPQSPGPGWRVGQVGASLAGQRDLGEKPSGRSECGLREPEHRLPGSVGLAAGSGPQGRVCALSQAGGPLVLDFHFIFLFLCHRKMVPQASRWMTCLTF